jgi:hypothetical protein
MVGSGSLRFPADLQNYLDPAMLLSRREDFPEGWRASGTGSGSSFDAGDSHPSRLHQAAQPIGGRLLGEMEVLSKLGWYRVRSCQQIAHELLFQSICPSVDHRALSFVCAPGIMRAGSSW